MTQYMSLRFFTLSSIRATFFNWTRIWNSLLSPHLERSTSEAHGYPSSTLRSFHEDFLFPLGGCLCFLLSLSTAGASSRLQVAPSPGKILLRFRLLFLRVIAPRRGFLLPLGVLLRAAVPASPHTCRKKNTYLRFLTVVFPSEAFTVCITKMLLFPYRGVVFPSPNCHKDRRDTKRFCPLFLKDECEQASNQPRIFSLQAGLLRKPFTPLVNLFKFAAFDVWN